MFAQYRGFDAGQLDRFRAQRASYAMLEEVAAGLTAGTESARRRSA